jgi:hypothetical protein
VDLTSSHRSGSRLRECKDEQLPYIPNSDLVISATCGNVESKISPNSISTADTEFAWLCEYKISALEIPRGANKNFARPFTAGIVARISNFPCLISK